MRSIAMYAAVGALVTPLVIGGAGLASADQGPRYEGTHHSANKHGGTSSKTKSGFTEDGTAYFVKVTKTSDSTSRTTSATSSHA
ncbi:hypothetical protein [Streptomyces sp. NPDC016845]|uniref:hypothetical protein n=1 Tax=Streptomyces sp. NPDC016845 TaxID=3364972 RepID=UPI0037901C13